MAAMLCVMLVNGRSECKAGGVPPCVVHKGGYGTARHGEETSAVTGGRGARTTGGRSPAPARTRTGPGRDAAARWPHARTSPLFPIACLAAPRLTLAAQDCGGYTGYFRGVVLPEQ